MFDMLESGVGLLEEGRVYALLVSVAARHVQLHFARAPKDTRQATPAPIPVRGSTHQAVVVSHVTVATLELDEQSPDVWTVNVPVVVPVAVARSTTSTLPSATIDEIIHIMVENFGCRRRQRIRSTRGTAAVGIPS